MNAEWMKNGEVWKWFGLICSVPHPSGHEQALRARLDLSARMLGLRTRTDRAGNLRIDRPVQSGGENLPAILLEAHLDMVPQAAPGVEFDFTTDEIEAVLENGRLSTGGRTTLGGDDGIGMAMAMTLLADRTSYRGALSALFTISEETGLIGAGKVERDFLECDCLLNLDAGGEMLVIGCYGGKRFDANWTVPVENPPSGMAAFTVTLEGLHGGHSAMDIDRNFGNAIRELAALLQTVPGIRIADLHGGSADNAIPRSAAATVMADAAGVAALRANAAQREQTVFPPYRQEGAEPHFVIAPAPAPAQVWDAAAAATILTALTTTPDGVLGWEPSGEIRLSCNLGIARYDAGKSAFNCCFLARSLNNAYKQEFAAKTADSLHRQGAVVTMTSEYSGWQPRPGGAVTRRAAALYGGIFGREPQLVIERGGLETGIFSGVRPELEMLGFGPFMGNLHSPSEWLDAASVGRVEQFLRALLRDLEERPLC